MSIDEDFINAAENGYLKTARYLISLGADIHAQENQALIYAAKEGHLSMVKYLVSLGADIHAQEDEALRWSSAGSYM